MAVDLTKYLKFATAVATDLEQAKADQAAAFTALQAAQNAYDAATNTVRAFEAVEKMMILVQKIPTPPPASPVQ